MFIQTIEGKISDPAGLDRQLDKWQAELRSGAKGILGSTHGVTSDGTAFAIVRFDSADSAQANSNRPEQGEWWKETEKLYSGGVTFRDSTDVQTYLDYGDACDNAGFVQVMQGRCTDRARLEELESGMLDQLRNSRSSIIGMLRAWFDGDEFVQVVYFRDEAQARKEEASQTDESGPLEEWMKLMPEIRYLDLTSPRMT